MLMSVITISRQYGSGGDEIAEMICNKTGYRMFDKYILARAAQETGLSGQEIVDYSEDQYKAQTFFERLFRRSKPVAQMRTWIEVKDGVRVSEQLGLSEEQALRFVRKAVIAAYKLGNVVIVGRGGQVILRDHPGVLHVRVEAPLEERIQRVCSYPELARRSFSDAVESRRAAQELIEKSDAASKDYLKRFYNVDWSDSSLYHLIINTGKLSIEQAAGIIVELLHQIERAHEST
jgi:cytidylate kinase